MPPPFENPFASRFVQPGAIPFQLPADVSTDNLIGRLQEIPERRAAIVGPHGSGKSTLLASLLARWRETQPEQAICSYQLPPRSSGAKIGLDWMRWDRSTLVVIDGFEQMSWACQTLMRGWLASRRFYLLVTIHKPLAWLPVLWETTIDDQLAEKLLRAVLARHPEWVEPILASSRWHESRGRWKTNFRETLFDLYDLIEDGDPNRPCQAVCR